MAVPFKPSKTDLIDTTRRATSVLKAGYVLAVAGEGRLSDREGEIVPLAGRRRPSSRCAPACRSCPMAIIGTHWLRFGKTVTMRVGPVVELNGRRADREGVASLTAELQDGDGAPARGDVTDEPPPGPFGRWMTDVLRRPAVAQRAETTPPTTPA